MFGDLLPANYLLQVIIIIIFFPSKVDKFNIKEHQRLDRVSVRGDRLRSSPAQRPTPQQG